MGPLSTRRFIIVTGKGGVGKTTIAAALAMNFAHQGLRTLVCEVNAKERITTLLGKPAAGAQLSQLEDNLWSVDVQPQEALKEYVLMIVKFERIYKAVFGNRVVNYFLRFIPSIQELVMLGKVLFHLRQKDSDGRFRFDRVVLDAPATGHAITFLSVPQVILNTVPPGPLANDAQWMRELLIDSKTTGAVLVSLPEELPINETLDLHRALNERVHIETVATILNGAISERFSTAELSSLNGDLAPFAHDHEERARMSADAERRLSQLQLPLVKVPRIYAPHFGRAAVVHIARELVSLTQETAS